jgi:hypothetical protein
MSDEFRRLWEQQETWRRLTDPLGDLRRHIDPLGDIYKQIGLGSTTMEFLRQEEERRKLLSGIADLAHLIGVVQTGVTRKGELVLLGRLMAR